MDTTPTARVQRSPMLDRLRGLAVVHMIFFHFSYDLMLFGLVDIDFRQDFLWWIQPRIIVAIFMSAVGASLYLAHARAIQWKKFIFRWLKLAAAAFTISLATYFAFPETWVYFGTLHSIATCSLLALPFVKFPRAALLVGVAILASLLIDSWQWPWIQLPHASMDYIPPFPWLGFCLIGIFATHMGLFNYVLPKDVFPLAQRLLELAGQWAFSIYLIHQPLLYVLVLGATGALNLLF